MNGNQCTQYGTRWRRSNYTGKPQQLYDHRGDSVALAELLEMLDRLSFTIFQAALVQSMLRSLRRRRGYGSCYKNQDSTDSADQTLPTVS